MEQLLARARVLSMMVAGFAARSLYTATKLGIADLLRTGPQTVSALAKATSTHEETLHRLLRALSTAGVFAEASGAYELTPMSRCLIDEPGSARGAVLWLGDPCIEKAWAELQIAVESGRPSFEAVHGRSLSAYLEQTADAALVYEQWQTTASALRSTLPRFFDFAGARRVVDVGGADGAVLRAILEQQPEARGVLFDLPKVAAATNASLEGGSVASRISVEAGDFFESVPQGDVLVLSHVLHLFDDDRAVQILENCRDSLLVGGRLVVAEALINDTPDAARAKWADVYMMVVSGGRNRTEGEFRALFERAGLVLSKVLPTTAGFALLEAKRREDYVAPAARTSEATTRIPAERLRYVLQSIFAARGVDPAQAPTVAEVMVEAELRGVESHGVMLTPFYLQLIARELVNLRPQLRVVRESPSTATLACDRAFGAVAATHAMELAVEKARAAGIACVVARDLLHTGMSGYYAERAAQLGMIGIFMNNGPRSMPAFGGVERVLCTNPLAVAIPTASGEALLLDMATSATALGQVFRARQEGRTIPMGWGTDSTGAPTQDPTAVLAGGFLQWAGGHKGYGLAVMIEILTGVLAEGVFGASMPDLFPIGESPIRYNAFCLAIDPTRFSPREVFTDGVERLRQDLKRTKRAVNVTEIYLPGEQGSAKRSEYLRQGIPLSDASKESLRRCASEAGLDLDRLLGLI